MAERCGYTHDVSGERFDDLEGDTWRCPHPSADGSRCPFHDSETDTDLGSLLLERVAAEDPAYNQFIGASCGGLTVDYAIVQGETNHPIDLREADIDGAFSCTDAAVSQSLRLDGTRIDDEVRLTASTFDGRVMLVETTMASLECEEATFRRRFDIGSTTVHGGANLRLIACESWVDMRDAHLVGPAHFRNARFDKGIYGVGARFEEGPDFVNATFEKVGNFKQATFEQGANFSHVDAVNSLDFREAAFLGELEFQISKASGRLPERRAAFDGVGWFEGMAVGTDVRFHGATIAGDLQLVDTVVEGELVIDPAPDQSAAAVTVDCTESAIAEGEIVSPPDGCWRYDFSEATVGDIRFTGNGDPFDVSRFYDTTFDGFDFSAPRHRESLSRNDWRLHDPDSDTPPPELENTYLKAKNGANRVGASKAAAEFFRNEMAARRWQHWRLLWDRNRSPGERILSGVRWAANGLLATTSGYGERPSYVIAWSVATVVGFALFYAATLGGLFSPQSLGEFLLFSFQSFISFILGSPPATPVLAVRIASAVQGFIGAFFIALFVFTLTRSIHR